MKNDIFENINKASLCVSDDRLGRRDTYAVVTDGYIGFYNNKIIIGDVIEYNSDIFYFTYRNIIRILKANGFINTHCKDANNGGIIYKKK
jgi:hypothetical protein